ncbi:MAG: hydrogenase small subunit [Peptococcaceae bacterium]|nr:hydrogenase small subunit [Peptococcaceae bacterium]
MASYLKTSVISRRDFIKMVAAAAAALGMAELIPPKIAAEAAGKPAVVWLHGQECTGCTESVLAILPGSGSDQPDIRDFLLDTISMRYHETIMASAGYVAEDWLEENILEGGYLLVVEGSIPTVDDRYLYVAGKPLRLTLQDAAASSAAIIAIGACAAYGGIPAASPSQGKGIEDFISGKPLCNLPGCPLRPEWFFGTVNYYLKHGIFPALDVYKRPKSYFGTTVHDHCPRRNNYDNGLFLTDWNDPSQAGYCLLYKGCKGMETYSDCPSRLWNDGINWCIGSNAPCAGCTEPKFYAGFSPLYKNTSS